MKRAREGNDKREGSTPGPPSARRDIKEEREDDGAQQDAGVGRAFGSRDLIEGVIGGEGARPEDQPNVVEQENGSCEETRAEPGMGERIVEKSDLAARDPQSAEDGDAEDGAGDDGTAEREKPGSRRSSRASTAST
jgi:hypothetical protein